MSKPTFEDLADLTQEVIRCAGEVAVACEEHKMAAWHQTQMEEQLEKAEAELRQAQEALLAEGGQPRLN